LSILRIIAAFVYGVHGRQKLFGFLRAVPGAAPSSAVFSRRHDRDFRGLLLLIGLFTRPVGFVLSGETTVANFKFHAPQGSWPLLNDGEGAVLYCCIFLISREHAWRVVEL